MKAHLIGALALSLVFSQVAAVSAYAAQPVAFRTAQPTTFSANDLQRYGLNGADAAKVEQLQSQGYTVKVMSKDEAQKYHAGQWSQTTWLIVGAVVIVAIAVAASN